MSRIPPREDIIALREEKKLTRGEIAAHYGVSVATIRRWIRDLKIPRPARKTPVKKYVASQGDMGWDAFNSVEQAQILLGPRMIEKVNHGYYIDGKPASINHVLAAAGLPS